MPDQPPTTGAGKDRELLRTAGEHVGTLAERAKELWELTYAGNTRQRAYDRYARLSRLSRELLEIANDAL